MSRRVDVETWVLDACRDLGLRLDGPDDDFFDGGGNSLSAMKLIARVEEEFGEDALPPEDLFTDSTVRQIAARIESAQQRVDVLRDA